MKDFKTAFGKAFSSVGKTVSKPFSTAGMKHSHAARKQKKESFNRNVRTVRVRTTAQTDNVGIDFSKSFDNFGENTILKDFGSYVVKHSRVFAGIAAAAVAVPILCVVSVGNAQVAVIEQISFEDPVVETVQDDSSDLFEGIEDESEVPAEMDVTSDTASELYAEGNLVEGETSTDITITEELADGKPVPKYTEFSEGMTDGTVIDIQKRLMQLDYMEEDEPTNYYGPMTTRAIGYFQRKNGLEKDGIAGEETQKLLFSEDAKRYTVSEGDEGADVEGFQERLKELGYNVSVTGYFGSDTTKAVAYFQRMTGLTDDGCVGAQTKEALYDDEAEHSIEYWERLKAKEEEKKSSSKKSDSSSKSEKKSSSKKSDSSKSEKKSSDSGSSEKKKSTTKKSDPGSVSSFIEVAESLAGTPYVSGGKSESGVDCSGFVYLALKNSGNSIGYMTSGGWAGSGYPTVYSMDELERGDIVCFSGHVGIYLGGGDMIDASSSQGKVRYCSNIQGSDYWTSHFKCGKRPL